MRASRRADVEPIEQSVVDAALALAAEDGWEQVRLSTIADRTGLPLAEIGRHFRDVDAIANAWFARARLAMLALPAGELAGRIADERIALAFIAWLDSLAPHRRAAAEILRHKLYPSSALAALADHDAPLPIGFDKTISQLFIVAVMTDLLAPEPTDSVLEVGTGGPWRSAPADRAPPCRVPPR